MHKLKKHQKVKDIPIKSIGDCEMVLVDESGQLDREVDIVLDRLKKGLARYQVQIIIEDSSNDNSV